MKKLSDCIVKFLIDHDLTEYNKNFKLKCFQVGAKTLSDCPTKLATQMTKSIFYLIRIKVVPVEAKGFLIT